VRVLEVTSVFDPALHRRDVARIGGAREGSLRSDPHRASLSEHAQLERLQAEFWLKGSLSLK
jgi:hypothetical protein